MRAIPREVFDGVASDAGHAYGFGLWCADGYWWSSSVGITSVDPDLVIRFSSYLTDFLDPDRLRLRIYEVGEPDSRVLALTEKVSVRPPHKMKRTAYQLYVNSRPLVRSFFAARRRISEVPDVVIGPYFAGRFDGDGCWGSTPRIAYTKREEAEVDQELLRRAGIGSTSILFYERANEYCIYIHRPEWACFENLIRAHSCKVSRRNTL